MKRINSYILTGGVIILGLCGCTSNFDDYNKDPNRAEVGKANSSQTVSYTHLTLPTILRV